MKVKSGSYCQNIQQEIQNQSFPDMLSPSVSYFIYCPEVLAGTSL